jgi:hypothetical protein
MTHGGLAESPISSAKGRVSQDVVKQATSARVRGPA